jgi:hypothetical protein
MKNVANQCELDDSYHDFRISMKYRGNSFYSLVPIFVVSTKCIDPCDLEFVVLNTTGNNQWAPDLFDPKTVLLLQVEG